jgi:sialate O-acetylesterase
MICRNLLQIGLAALGILGSATCGAELSVSPIFRDDMILQRDMLLPVFGTADPNATITVSFGGQNIVTEADAGGVWLAMLDPLTANDFPSPSPMTVTTDSGDAITFSGVQVGEVWLCSGQSNMGYPLSNANDGAAAVADAGQHNIRLFRMTAGSGPETTNWQVADSSTAGSFSAVCYWMGLELSQWFADVPVGLIQATHDGTAIAHWQHTYDGIGDDYDAMVRAIQPYAVRGVLWYQGESNGGDAAYAGKLASMIDEWRSDWGQDSLPFGIVQLAYRSGWNTARNAQLEVADSIGDAFLVVIRDLPGGALHPPEKKPVGIRSAIGARGLVYGDMDITGYSGPIRDVENSFVDGDTVVLHWKHVADGLFTDDNLPPGEFKLAGVDGRFKSADAVIMGDTVEVRSSRVSEPVKVQYSYRSIGNLYNRTYIATEGLVGFVDRLKASEFEFALNTGDSNRLPVAQFTYQVSGLSVSLDASSSHDYEGPLAAFDWDLGDGNSATGVAPTHEYPSAGDYSVALTVTDGDGATDSMSQTVTVSDPDGEATSIHVASLQAYAGGVGRGFKQGVAEVIVRDDLNDPFAGAVVTVQFSGTFNETRSGTTDADGFVRLQTDGQMKGLVQVGACIDGLSGALEYIPNATACDP